MKHLDVVLLLAGLTTVGLNASAASLQIDRQQSKIEVAVSSTIDSFMGHLEKYQASVECAPTEALPPRAEVSFNFADLKTGNTDRDAAMLKWLQYDAHPGAAFHLTGWSQSGTTNIATGQLTIHGVTIAVQMPTVVTHNGTTWDISGQTTFDYRDFKLSKIRKLVVLTVDPQLTVKFHLSGKLSGTN